MCSDTSVHYGQGAIFVGFLVRLGHVAVATAFLLPLISSAPASADATVRIGGSTNDTPALTKIAVAYQAANPGTTVSIKGSSSGEGIAALKGHSLDIACSDVAVDDPYGRPQGADTFQLIGVSARRSHDHDGNPTAPPAVGERLP